MIEQFILGFQMAMLFVSAILGALTAGALVIGAGAVLIIGSQFVWAVVTRADGKGEAS